MGGCSILGCKSRTERNAIAEVTFHSFPTDKNLKNAWINATGRQNWQPNKSSKICSIHFSKNTISIVNKNKKIKPKAIPVKHIHFLKPTITLIKTENLLRSLLEDDSASNVKHSLDTRKSFSNDQDTDPLDTQKSSLNDQENQNVKRSLNTRKSSARNQENKNFKHSLDTRKSFSDDLDKDPLDTQKSFLNDHDKDPLGTRKSFSNDQYKDSLDTQNSSLNEQENTNVKHSLDTRKLLLNDQENDDASTVSCVSETGLTEIDSSDLESPLETPCEIKLKKKLKEKENECKGHLVKIEALEATNRRLCEKNKTLKLVLKRLKRKIMVLNKNNVNIVFSDEDSSS